MKKILIFSNDSTYTYNFRKEIIKELRVRNFKIILATNYSGHLEELKNMGLVLEESKINRRGKNPFADTKLYRYYKKLIKKHNPDILLTYNIKPNIYGGIAAKKLKTPYIANITGLGTAVENGGILQKITTFLYKKAFKNINTVFFQNQENLDFFISKKIALDKHKLIPGSGVNLKKFKLKEYPNDEIIRFVFISRIMKEKGIEYYLDAAKVIKEKYSNVEFHIYGMIEDGYDGNLTNMIDIGIVKYHGIVQNIDEELGKYHCIVHPTYYPEGMSNVLLEAAASGRPIITTNRSGCREIVDNGVNGYLVDVKDLSQLTKTIEKFIALTNEKKKDMGIAGRKKIEKEFDRQIVVDAYMKEIENILNERDKDIKWKLQ